LFNNVYANSDDNAEDHLYWTKLTGKFKNKNSIQFGNNIAGIINPIVTYFTTWPVSNQYSIQYDVILYTLL